MFYTRGKKQLTVPLIETMIVPVIVPNRRPADMVKGIAGIARIWDNILVKVSVKLQIINMS